MAQPANPKVEELRARLKADPKSRLFYQLAEELRRTGQTAEAEQVLRAGVAVHPGYLAPWVSLGRVLRERKDDRGAVEALQHALQLDPGNVVAARLLGEAFLALGDKVEAIKKFKLVHALLPGDEEVEATIVRLDRELNPPRVVALSEPAAEESYDAEAQTFEEPAPAYGDVTPAGSSGATQEPFEDGGPAAEAVPAGEQPRRESPFDKTLPPFAEVADSFARAAGEETPAPAEELSPFDEPYEEELPELPAEEQDAGEPSASYLEIPSDDSHGDPAETVTMAELYLRQGLASEAKRIYAKILLRDPENAEIRAKLAAIDGEAVPPPAADKVVKLERWLARISGKEAGRV